ncbi:NUDIX domain-containing protein [Ktedonosporobacter rubrisoli]|uniref:NUDIX domain-containing protein n=1 Tax=Ktedonosporobacter rubrisoli TaxID=2509675 RepID=A0A4P6JN34_KTERU|nr:NUDIX domain-containing protein [Ktedonosporobacter rubrisoli]QBD76452.1 NUDIX domain-containing protein [Ktedonosporobacter rubrisoli]
MPNVIDKLAWIYIENKRLLCTRSKGKDTWYIPGGKREPAETDWQALRREVKEELDVELRPGSIKFFGKFEAQAHGKAEGILVRMTCYTAEFAGTISASSEIEEVCWLPYADREKTSLVDHLIFDALKEKNMID